MAVKNVFKLRLSVHGECNYSCFFCHNEGRASFSPNMMSLEYVLLLSKGAYMAGIRSFTLTGGEPLKNPRTLMFIGKLRKLLPDATIKLTTNALLLKHKDIPFLRDNIDKIRINFQAADRDAFRSLVGVDGYDYVTSLIDAIASTTAIHICLNYVFNIRSEQLLPGVLLFAKQRNLEMKVLELIKNPSNCMYHVPIERAFALLSKQADVTRKDYQNDDLFFIGDNNTKIRLCYSHCNASDGESCRLLGELRTSPDLDIYPCMHRLTPKTKSNRDMTPEDIASLVHHMDALKGVCPVNEAGRL